MPLSHDSKPRNRSRRNKSALVTKTYAKKASPHRAAMRRLLQRRFEAHCKAQRQLEEALRSYGVSWRQLEKMVHQHLGGKFNKLTYSQVEKWFGVTIERKAA